ncbi:hypothetical protein IV40_GL000562 [Lactobacillus selangorensis]|nr:hypothetical protein IV40_GL000562 [Lactobacillus selangorensis]
MGGLFLTATPVQADMPQYDTILPVQQPSVATITQTSVPVYNSPATVGTTQRLTGQYLAKGTAWKINRFIVVNRTDPLSTGWIDLGANQWVNMQDVIFTQLYRDANNTNVQRIYGITPIATITPAQSSVPVYNSPYTGAVPTGETLPAWSRWKILRIGHSIDGATYYDLGSNQWISATDAFFPGA